MSLDWEKHRSLLEDLRLKHSVKQIIGIMKERHNFIATENQYLARFQEWPAAVARKNLNKVEWKHIRKIVERRDKAGQKSQVLFYDRLIEDSRIRKGMTRVLNTYTSSPSPQAPSSIQIFTPPATHIHSDSITNSQTTLKRANTDLRDRPTSRTKRKYKTVTQRCNQSARMHNGAIQMINPEMPRITIDETNLPYFEFLRAMESLQISVGPQPLLKGDLFDFSVTKYISSSSMAFSMNVDESLGLFNTNEAVFNEQLSPPLTENRFYESLARLLVPSDGGDNQDQLERLQELEKRLPQLLKDMPERYVGENDSNIDLLLGPPQPSAGLCLLNIVIYIYSNNLHSPIYVKSRDDSHVPTRDVVLNWIIDRVPFKVLAVLLQKRLPALHELQFELIYFAVRTNRRSFVQKMLELKVGLEDAVYSNALLEIAIDTGSTEMIKFLLDAGSDVTPLGDSRWVKSLYSHSFSIEIGNLLTAAGAELRASISSDIRSASGIWYLIRNNQLEMIQYWIDIGSDFYHLDDWLIIAVVENQLNVVNILLQAGATPKLDKFENVDEPESWGALQTAVRRGNVAIAQALLNAGSKTNYAAAYKGELSNCLGVAIVLGHEAIVRFLLENGADPDVRGYGLDTPILLAMSLPDPVLRSTLVQILLEHKANPNIPSIKTYLTALDLARLRGFAEIDIQLLLDAGAHTNDGQLTERFYKTYHLAEAIHQGDIHHIKEFSHNFSMEMIDFTDIHDLVLGDLEQAGYWDDDLPSKGTILHFALAQIRPDCSVFKFLVQNISDVNVQNSNGILSPILHVAVNYCTTDIVKILLDAGVDVNNISYARGSIPIASGTALLIAVMNTDAEMVQLLLDRGADINLRRYDDATPLQAAISSRQFDLARYLISRGANITAPAGEPHGSTALQYTSGQGSSDPGCSQMLSELLLVADVNETPSKYGMSALQEASRSGNLPFVVALLDNGAAIDFVSNDGIMTALSAAAGQGYMKVVQLLLSRGANVNAPGLLCTQRAIDQAAAKGRLDMVQYLINAGAHHDLPPDKRYYAALRWAEMREFIGVAALLRKLIDGREEELRQMQRLDMLDKQGERKCLSCNGKGCWKHIRLYHVDQVCPNCRGKGRVWSGEDEGDSEDVWHPIDVRDDETDDEETEDEETYY